MSNPTGTGGFKDNPKNAIHRGRPKSFDAFRKLAMVIGNELITGKDGTVMSRNEVILRSWSFSNNYQLQKQFMEIQFGKVPDALQISGPEGKPIRIIEIVKDEKPD